MLTQRPPAIMSSTQDGFIDRKMVVSLGTNWAQCRVSLLIKTGVLPLNKADICHSVLWWWHGCSDCLVHIRFVLSRMAPEVAAVERKGGYNEKCDIWAVGITAIEFAELQPPMFDLHPMRQGTLDIGKFALWILALAWLQMRCLTCRNNSSCGMIFASRWCPCMVYFAPVCKNNESTWWHCKHWPIIGWSLCLLLPMTVDVRRPVSIHIVQ